MQHNNDSRPEGETPSGQNPSTPEGQDREQQTAENAEAGGEALDPRDARIAALEAELADAKDQQLRAMAEVENVRRRAQREREEANKYGSVPLARDLLDVADNLRRALEVAPSPEENPSVQGLVEGITMVEKELIGVFERHHVRPVGMAGEPFDHNVHQAVVEMPANDIKPGHIAQVLQTGYLMHDRLLRAAMVAVAKEPE